LHALDRPARPGAKKGPLGSLNGLIADIERAEARVAQRRARLPRPKFPDDLPVSQRRAEIRQAIEENQVVVICGETGSGKTTQIPKICLEMGRGVMGTIGHTQPRRIAARSVATRIAEELGTRLGEAVGYKVRFGDKTGPNTVVKLMTDGILLAETQGDRALEQYDTLIIDEAHERSLNIDFLLGYVRTLLPRRPDLKVVITSATIDPQRFASHYAGPKGDAPIIMVSGRTYPVELLYRPPAAEDPDERDDEMQRAIVLAVDEAASYGDGDVLIFLSGEREIRETAESLSKHHVPGSPTTAILPLYAKLSAQEQMRVFQPHAGRRIVLATNVAETSLTVPGIRFVIDAGMARIGRYSARTKVQRLEIEAISRASADQRKGRCGRIGSGVCIRLYGEDDFNTRRQYTEPEILRTNLASVILQMTALQLGDVEKFPFLDPPDPRMIKDGYETLHELGAVSDKGQLTPLGRELAKLPIDPRIGRMILAGTKEKCLAEVLVIAAAMSVQDARERPMDAQERADKAHEEFEDTSSDFLGYLRLWSAFREQKRHLSGSKLRKWCKDNYLSYVRMREWEDIHHQLAELVGGMGHHVHGAPAPPEAVHRAMLSGLLGNIGFKAETGEYSGARAIRFNIFPGSALFRAGPKWVMAGELVRTTKLYARTVAGIRPEWLEELAGHLIRRTYSNPHWSRQAGRVIASERVTLFGMELVASRRVHYGPVDPVASREIFVHQALVEGELETRAPFFSHNRAMEDELRSMEARTRRQNLLADAHQRFEFYNSRVPREILTAGAFERWRFEETKKNPRLLFMSIADLIAPGAEVPTRALFPDEIDAGAVTLPLVYRYEPGHEADGVTVRVPIETLGQLPPERFAWMVPGHLREKVEIMVRGLGKEYRRVLPPASALAAKCTAQLVFAKGALVDQLRECIRAATTVDVPREALAAVPVPDYLRMRFEVLGDDGKVVASGRDLGAIKAALSAQLKGGLLKSDARFTRENIKHWDFGDLPERVEIDKFGVAFAAYPGIVDHKTHVSLRLFDTFEAATVATRAGTRRLFMFEAAEPLKRHTAYLPGIERLVLQYATLGKPSQLKSLIQELVADRAFIGDQLPVRTEKEFAFRVSLGMQRIGPAMNEAMPLVSGIFASYQAVQAQLGASKAAAWEASLADIREQLGHLMPSEFLVTVPFPWLRHYPRYLQAIQLRLQKLSGPGLARDAKNAAEIASLWKGYEELMRRQKELALDEAKIAELRWLIEELRVSFFAQELRTSVPVSTKRVQNAWAEIVGAVV